MESEFTPAEMSVNDSCRLCDRNLRTDGKIGNSMLIFDRKDKYGYIYDQLSKLGLDLDNTPLRSSRICRKCFTVIASLQRDKEIIDEWRKQEILETCQESCVSSTDNPTPSETTDTKSTDVALPSRSSGTEKPYGCLDCNKSFRKAVLLRRHQRLHTGENVLRCHQCDRPFTLASQLERHLRAHTRTPKYVKCSQCEKPFISLYYLHVHQNKLNDVKPTQCPHCDKVLSRTTCINYHRGKHLEGTQQYECSQCGKRLSSATKLKDHQRIHGEKPYKCSLCRAAFLRPSSLATHQLKHTGETPFKCCQCNQAFSRKMSLKNHKRTHDDAVGGQLCRCAQCEKIFAPPTRLTSLEKRRHKCTQCGKAFERLTYLRFHLRTHARAKPKGKPFRCDQCDMEFSSASLLKKHQRKHRKTSVRVGGHSHGRGPPGNYRCCQCDRVFDYKRPLRAHRKEAHPEAELCDCPLCRIIFAPHECVDCGKTFSCLSALVRHERTHTGEKPFLCSVCGRSFAQRTGLVQHEGVHLGERPYRCPSCGRAFASTTDLDGHHCRPEGIQEGAGSTGRNLTGARSAEEKGVTQPKPRPHECSDCNKSFRYAALLRRHQRLHTGENVFRCPQCDRPFILLTELEMHLRTHTHSHTPKPFKCSRCEKPFTRLRDFWTHQNKPKDIKPTQCPHCDKVFSRTTCVKYHRRKHPEATQNVCSQCGKGFSGATPLRNHQRLHEVKLYKRLPCDAAFLQPRLLARRRLARTDKRPSRCCQCHGAFQYKASLKHHRRMHDGDAGGQLCRCVQGETISAPPTRLQKRRHKCPHCGKAFVRLVHLRLHLRTHARERPFRCGRCERTFSYDSQLQVHKRSHQGATRVPRKAAGASQLKVRPKVVYPKMAHVSGGSYQCCRCERTFRQKRALRTHRKEAHAGVEPCACPKCRKIRPYECSECGKSFSVPSELRCHQKSHSNEKPYMCLHCGKSFAWPDSLRSHERTHSAVKQFVCFDCGKAFNVPADLRRHQRLHTGEMPYACEQCGKAFAVSGALRNHQRVHSDEKPFVCSICGKAFLWRHALVRHELVHTGAKPYPCLRCGRAFTRTTGLATHRCSAERHREGTEDASADS